VDILPATMTLTKSGTTYSNGNGSITITWESGTTCTVGLFPFGTPASCAVNRDDVTKPRITIVTTDPPGPPPSCTLALAVQ
jgi:hypothetical protein